MRHTPKESILQGPIHFYVGLRRSYLRHLCALLCVLKAGVLIVTMPCSDHQTGDRSSILQRNAHDLGRIDDAAFTWALCTMGVFTLSWSRVAPTVDSVCVRLN